MDWPTGIRPRGAGLEIRIWGKGGKREYTETIPCDPYSKAELAAAVKRRETLLARKRLGLSLRVNDGGAEIFQDVAQRWVNSLQIDPDQIRKYLNILNYHWMPAYASWPLTDITHADIKERLAKKQLAIKTQKNILGPLRMVLRHGGANPNPADGFEWPKRQGRVNKRVKRYLPKERDKILKQLDKLADRAAVLAQEKPIQKNLSDAHWRAQARVYFALLFATGLRPGEALGLLWRDYDGEFLNIEKQYTRSKAKDMTKTGQDRSVYVPTWVRPILDSHNTRLQGGPVFVAFKGEALKDTKRLNPVWSLAHDKARVPLRDPYTCRHTRAAELLSQGVSPAEGAMELGHSVPMFLSTYSELIAEYAPKRDYSRLEGSTYTTTYTTAQQ